MNAYAAEMPHNSTSNRPITPTDGRSSQASNKSRAKTASRIRSRDTANNMSANKQMVLTEFRKFT